MNPTAPGDCAGGITPTTPTTMNTKHTPGPWMESSFEVWSPLNGKPFGRVVANLRRAEGAHSEVKANARLIAAAPELLEALKAVLSFMDTDSRNDQQFDPALKLDASIAVEAAYEAIAKATAQ